MLAKLATVEAQADETVYWLELLVGSRVVDEKRVAELLKETNEITAMVVASIKTLRGRLRNFDNAEFVWLNQNQRLRTLWFSLCSIQNPKSKIQN
ncbi:MAG TPA: four helix bundle protein [Candidatus Binatia bacterium]